ncbi:MAG: hypothetical protein AAGA22_09240 [Pseudomonadota bacterium]
MAIISQRFALEVPNPAHERKPFSLVHSPLSRLRACRERKIFCPATEVFRADTDLFDGMQHLEERGVAILDHRRPLVRTDYEIDEESFDWLESNGPPPDFGQWFAGLVAQTWSAESRSHLLTIHDTEGVFVHCDPFADLSEVPVDIADVIEWAIAEKILWLVFFYPDSILAAPPVR